MHNDPPSSARITYNQQFRRCKKAGCPSCTPDRPGHGPYWYAYWRQDGRLRSRYLGKDAPLDTPLVTSPGQGAAPRSGESRGSKYADSGASATDGGASGSGLKATASRPGHDPL